VTREPAARAVDRIADALIFPRDPGFSVAVPIHLSNAQASDVILGDAARGRDRTRRKPPDQD
jgi:hypothetical protein